MSHRTTTKCALYLKRTIPDNASTSNELTRGRTRYRSRHSALKKTRQGKESPKCLYKLEAEHNEGVTPKVTIGAAEYGSIAEWRAHFEVHGVNHDQG